MQRVDIIILIKTLTEINIMKVIFNEILYSHFMRVFSEKRRKARKLLPLPATMTSLSIITKLHKQFGDKTHKYSKTQY